jgi:DNA-binding GntR family transcriptional regulator
MQSLTPSQTLQEQTYRAVLDAICDGTLAPGERLTQEGVAERLSVSRQPVAQALALLKTQGFVQETGRRGLVVAEIDPDFFRSIYELRAALDPLSARLAAARMSREAAAQGRALLAEGKRAIESPSLHTLVQRDAEFHMYVYELSGNPLIPEVMGHYWNHLRRAMGEVLRIKGEAEIVWRQHEALLDALIAGDGDGAERAARDHIVSARARTLSVVAPGD